MGNIHYDESGGNAKLRYQDKGEESITILVVLAVENDHDASDS